jgi:hypothetical protein
MSGATSGVFAKTEPSADDRPQRSPTAKKEERPPSQAELLVQIARTKGELFHDAYGDAYVSVVSVGGRETMKLRSRRARAWMDREYFTTFSRVPGGQANADAIATLEGIAIHGSGQRLVHLRTGEHEGRVYVDLGDETREQVEVDARGWRLVQRAPVSFVRPMGMGALPRPVPGGSVDELREFVNVKDDLHFRLLVAWIVAAQRPRGPYPILCLQGEQGSSKSTTTRLVRRLVDPNVSLTRAAPREVRDLAITARAAHVLAYDNLSGLPVWLSDALCRVSTGGGFATRALCTDDEEVIFDFVRPIVVNGIDDVATRPDLADRCLLVTLPPIPTSRRRRERDLTSAFEKAAPRIYGAILTALSGALAREPDVLLAELPRMADFAVFATAAERALGWRDGDFMAAYTANRRDTTAVALDADLVGQAVVRFMRDRADWEGPAKDLLEALAAVATDTERQSKAWPGAPHVLSARLRRSAPVLRDLGVDVDPDASEGRGRDKRRLVVLRTLAQPSVPGVRTVHPADNVQESDSPESAPAGRIPVKQRPQSSRGRSDGRSEPEPASTHSKGNLRAGDAGDAGDASSFSEETTAPFAEWLAGEGVQRGGAK